MNSSSFTNALPPIAPNNSSCSNFKVANDHAVFAKPCESKVQTCGRTISKSVENRESAFPKASGRRLGNAAPDSFAMRWSAVETFTALKLGACSRTMSRIDSTSRWFMMREFTALANAMLPAFRPGREPQVFDSCLSQLLVAIAVTVNRAIVLWG